MGASDAYPEEADPIAASVDGFWIDRYDVTHAQFAAFVQATGYSTLAERARNARTASDLMQVARDLYRWKLEMTHERR